MNSNPVKQVPLKRRKVPKVPAVDGHSDDFCEHPLYEGEATEDEDLPAADGGVEDDVVAKSR